MYVYGLELSYLELVESGSGEWKLKDIVPLSDFKKTAQVRFFRWQDAVKRSPCAITRAAIAQLLAEVL